MASVDDLSALLDQLHQVILSLLPVATDLGVNPTALKGMLQQTTDLSTSVVSIKQPGGLVTFAGSTPPIFTSWQVVQDPQGQVVSGFLTLDASQLPAIPGVIKFVTDHPEWVN